MKTLRSRVKKRNKKGTTKNWKRTIKVLSDAP